MEFNFKIKTQKPELIKNDEYPLFWQSAKNAGLFDEIGVCKVQLEDDNQVNCDATLTTGGIEHSINDVITSKFSPTDVFAGKFEYGILFKDDVHGNEYVYGFCLF